jgi:hypothetical protein
VCVVLLVLVGLWLNWGIGMVMALLVFLGYEWLSF